jgi:hypothetical protein
MLKLKDTEWTGSTPIAPQLIGCHQTNLQIRDPHQISYRFDVFKTKSMIWPKKKLSQAFFFAIFGYFNRHEIHPISHEDYENLVLFCVSSHIGAH